MQGDDIWDVFVIGGGVNGCGIARDAAGRGLRVALAEMDDLASATSSASTKMFHGGLRYLEYFEVGLVRQALAERETLLRAMPHISWPMRFVLPLHPDLRFDTQTPASRLLSWVMPWARGRRPDWLIRLGLFFYDHLGGRKILPATRTLDLRSDPAGVPLQGKFRRAFEYSDCWVEDSRLVALNARDAAQNGAKIMTRTKVAKAERLGDLWLVTVEGPGGIATFHARALVNAGGPWVEKLVGLAGLKSAARIRLVRGSHIVTRRLFDHDRGYFLQGSDGRIIFAIPYETDFTLIGTTDTDHQGDPSEASCSEAEQDYLCAFASRYFEAPVTRGDIVWTFAGVRPLFDDGASSASAATRDYSLMLDAAGGAPLLSVFGGKITTYRKLSEAALAKLAPFFPGAKGAWTAGAPLPGGDFAVDGVARLIAELRASYGFLGARQAARLVRAYGTEAALMLGQARSLEDLGQDFGAGLCEREVRWLIDREFARSAEDIVWRRSKLGLRMSPGEVAALEQFVAETLAKSGAAA